MKCPHNIVNLMHDYLDGDIEPHDEKILREHLQQCSACADHFNGLKKTVAFIQHASHITPPSDFTARVMTQLPKEKKTIRIRRWLQNHPFITAASLFIILTIGSLFTTWNEQRSYCHRSERRSRSRRYCRSQRFYKDRRKSRGQCYCDSWRKIFSFCRTSNRRD